MAVTVQGRSTDPDQGIFRGSDPDLVFFVGFVSGSRLGPTGSAPLLVPQLLLSQSEPEKRAKTTHTKKNMPLFLMRKMENKQFILKKS